MKIEIEGRFMTVTANQTRAGQGASSEFLLLRIGAEFGKYGFTPNGMTGEPTGSGTFVVAGYKD